MECESDRMQLKNLINETSIVPENPKHKSIGAPMAIFNSSHDIICGSCPTKPSDRMTNSLYVISETIPRKRRMQRSQSTSDLATLATCLTNKNEKLCRDLIYLKELYINDHLLATPSSIGDSTFETSGRKLSPTTASIYFSYNPLGCQFNTIEKSLIKRKTSSAARGRDNFNEIHLLSIELDSPAHMKPTAHILEETPLLTTKLNKTQMRQAKETRKLAPCESESPKMTIKSQCLVNTPASSSMSAENQRNVLNTIEHEQRPVDFDRPPSCIQSLVEMIKLIKSKLWSEDKINPSTTAMNSIPMITQKSRDQMMCP